MDGVARWRLGDTHSMVENLHCKENISYLESSRDIETTNTRSPSPRPLAPARRQRDTSVPGIAEIRERAREARRMREKEREGLKVEQKDANDPLEICEARKEEDEISSKKVESVERK